ncbi:hypothetical protein J7U46_16775 [Pelomonas sp. V22]|uniref:hypothetical protein n=1 Tax=Pelomonas sp. V22 TaxID=2822139 RepID=UPI0024A9DDDF|nr:hypothetical protein [Pelomonas sp. V22]MDI4634717.1 hypothetical protein [Pelomonas sp. V22]
MSILNLAYHASIQERDVDLLIVEELSSSDEFADWLVARTWGLKKFSSSVGAWHSVTSGSLGESDAVFVFISHDGTRRALLLENKIDAIAQPEQAARYRMRGDAGQASEDWAEHRSVVIAPARYLSSEKHPGGYDYEISYEELMAYFSCRRTRDRRFAYKAQVINEAIEQNRRRPVRVLSREVTDYFKAYGEYARTSFPELGVREPGERAAGNTWMYFRPAGFPNDVQLVHQTTSGFAKLFFDGQADRFDDIQQRVKPHLSPIMRLEPAGKSVSVSIAVPALAPSTGSFGADAAGAEKALVALRELEGAYRRAFVDANTQS